MFFLYIWTSALFLCKRYFNQLTTECLLQQLLKFSFFFFLLGEHTLVCNTTALASCVCKPIRNNHLCEPDPQLANFMHQSIQYSTIAPQQHNCQRGQRRLLRLRVCFERGRERIEEKVDYCIQCFCKLLITLPTQNHFFHLPVGRLTKHTACSPAMPVVPFTRTSVRIYDYLHCQLKGTTTLFPPFRLCNFHRDGEAD